MKLAPPRNANYAATVIRVRKVNTLPNCDNLVGVPIMGYQAITQKGIEEGDLRILFTAGTQLSEEYAWANNLHRHEHLNADPTEKGYLEDNRRVKAVRLRGNRSDALLMPLESLSYLEINPGDLREGDTFDEINGHEVCKKYISPRRGRSGLPVARTSQSDRVDERLFPRHFDTPNYFRAPEVIPGDMVGTVTQKLHGTSFRAGNILVDRKLTWLERLAKRLGISVREQEWAYVYGSRNVVKDPNNPALPNGPYGSDIYTEVGSRLEGLIPRGWVVYGEIVGWVPGTSQPIQRAYTYGLPEGSAELYVYRIAVVSPEGVSVDLSWDAVQEWCSSVGVLSVPELAAGYCIDEGFVGTFVDSRLADKYPFALPVDAGQVDEGVCIRTEGLTPTIVKAKSPKFFEHESRLLDSGTLDMEEEA